MLLLTDGRLGDRPVDVLIGSGRIQAIETAGSGSIEADERIDLAGRRVLPGFHDAHTHFAAWATERRRQPLHDSLAAARSLDEAAAAVATHGPADGWVIGMGFQRGYWSDAPDKAALDRALPDRLVAISSHDGHSGLVSSAALSWLGIDHPTGYLQEREWAEAVSRLPLAAGEELEQAIDDALAHAASRGLTSIVDIDADIHARGRWADRVAGAQGWLPLRVAACVLEAHLDEAIDEGFRTGRGHGMVVDNRLKLFSDGALGSRTALCSHPYEHDDGNHGQQLLSVQEMVALIGRAHAAGIETTIHAIGDAAVDHALTAFERSGRPGRIEHAQLVAEPDLARFARLGVEASVQPVHATDDRDLSDRWWGDRSDRAFPFRSLLDAGAKLRLGSDAPIAPLDPWQAIGAAVTRTGDDRPPWYPEQSLTLAEAIHASTVSSVEVGAVADLVVPEHDPFEVDPRDLASMPVFATVTAGRVSHTIDQSHVGDRSPRIERSTT